LYRQTGREHEGEGVLRAALAATPRDAELHYGPGLALVRLKQRDEAIVELRRVSELEPDRARFAYISAVALHSTGELQKRSPY
jgi:Flp pilus assembly protein TadD